MRVEQPFQRSRHFAGPFSETHAGGTARRAAVDAGRVGGRQRHDDVGAGCPVAARLLAQDRLVCIIEKHLLHLIVNFKVQMLQPDAHKSQ